GIVGCAADSMATSIPVSAMLPAIDRSMPRVTSASICASAMIARIAQSVTSVSRLVRLRNTGARTAIAATSTAVMTASTDSRWRARLRIHPVGTGAEPGGCGDDDTGVEFSARQDPGDPALVRDRDAIGDAHQLGQLGAHDDHRDSLCDELADHLVHGRLGPDVDSLGWLADT